MQATKIASVNAQGRLRKTNQWKASTDARINQLLTALGIDKDEYKFKASIRKHERAFNLGINY
jgi:hypothetical protein